MSEPKKILIPEDMEGVYNVATSYRAVSPGETLGVQVDPSGGTSRKKLSASAIVYTDRMGNEVIVFDADVPEPDDDDDSEEIEVANFKESEGVA